MVNFKYGNLVKITLRKLMAYVENMDEYSLVPNISILKYLDREMVITSETGEGILLNEIDFSQGYGLDPEILTYVREGYWDFKGYFDKGTDEVGFSYFIRNGTTLLYFVEGEEVTISLSLWEKILKWKDTFTASALKDVISEGMDVINSWTRTSIILEGGQVLTRGRINKLQKVFEENKVMTRLR